MVFSKKKKMLLGIGGEMEGVVGSDRGRRETLRSLASFEHPEGEGLG